MQQKSSSLSTKLNLSSSMALTCVCGCVCQIAALSMNKLTCQKCMTPALFHTFTSQEKKREEEREKSRAPFIWRMASQFISISCRARVTSESQLSDEQLHLALHLHLNPKIRYFTNTACEERCPSCLFHLRGARASRITTPPSLTSNSSLKWRSAQVTGLLTSQNGL